MRYCLLSFTPISPPAPSPVFMADPSAPPPKRRRNRRRMVVMLGTMLLEEGENIT